jgi:hypothetical protein
MARAGSRQRSFHRPVIGIRVAHFRQAVFRRQRPGAFACDQYVRRALHDDPGRSDGADDAGEGRNRPGITGAPVHDGGVQLISPIRIGRSALAGQVQAGLFQRRDHGLHNVQCGHASGQPLAAFAQQLGHVRFFARIVAPENRSGAAMQGDGPFPRHSW